MPQCLQCVLGGISRALAPELALGTGSGQVLSQRPTGFLASSHSARRPERGYEHLQQTRVHMACSSKRE